MEPICDFNERSAYLRFYRPPNADREGFRGCLAFDRDCIGELLDDSFEVCLTVDLNFPHIDWKCERVQSGQDEESWNSADDLLQLVESNLMVQLVDSPTRGRYILEFFVQIQGVPKKKQVRD